MKRYIFKTTTTMKEYNNKKWWIDSNVVRDKSILAENLKEAMEKYRKIVEEKDYIAIDGTKQIGYVITGKTEFQDNFGRWTEQYIDLWVNIVTVIDMEF